MAGQLPDNVVRVFQSDFDCLSGDKSYSAYSIDSRNDYKDDVVGLGSCKPWSFDQKDRTKALEFAAKALELCRKSGWVVDFGDHVGLDLGGQSPHAIHQVPHKITVTYNWYEKVALQGIAVVGQEFCIAAEHAMHAAEVSAGYYEKGEGYLFHPHKVYVLSDNSVLGMHIAAKYAATATLWGHKHPSFVGVGETAAEAIASAKEATEDFERCLLPQEISE